MRPHVGTCETGCRLRLKTEVAIETRITQYEHCAPTFLRACLNASRTSALPTPDRSGLTETGPSPRALKGAAMFEGLAWPTIRARSTATRAMMLSPLRSQLVHQMSFGHSAEGGPHDLADLQPVIRAFFTNDHRSELPPRCAPEMARPGLLAGARGNRLSIGKAPRLRHGRAVLHLS